MSPTPIILSRSDVFTSILAVVVPPCKDIRRKHTLETHLEKGEGSGGILVGQSVHEAQNCMFYMEEKAQNASALCLLSDPFFVFVCITFQQTRQRRPLVRKQTVLNLANVNKLSAGVHMCGRQEFASRGGAGPFDWLIGLLLPCGMRECPIETYITKQLCPWLVGVCSAGVSSCLGVSYESHELHWRIVLFSCAALLAVI